MSAVLSQNSDLKLFADEEVMQGDLVQAALVDLWNALDSVRETKSTKWTRKSLNHGVAIEKVDDPNNPEYSVFKLVGISCEGI